LERTWINKFSDPEAAGRFLDEIHKRKTRYVRDQFLLIEKTLSEYDPQAVESALQYCLINELYSAVDFKDALTHFSQGIKKAPLSAEPVTIHKTSGTIISGVEVAKRDLQKMIQSLKGENDPWLN